MNAYLPRDMAVFWLVVGMLAGTLAAGLVITRLHRVRVARILAWALVVSATAGVERLCADEPAGFQERRNVRERTGHFLLNRFPVQDRLIPAGRGRIQTRSRCSLFAFGPIRRLERQGPRLVAHALG